MIPIFRHFVAEEAAARVAQVLASGCIGQGPVVDEFELALVPWIGENVTVSSGTAALELAYDLAGLRRGDTVISTPITCAATNIPLARMGIEILWAECDPRTGLIDPGDVLDLFKRHPIKRIKAVVSVDYGGALVDYPLLYDISKRYNALLISDAAHSFGWNVDDMPCDYRCYSFQAIKLLTTINGGALCCPNQKTHDRAKLKRWFGLDRTKGDFRCSQTITELGYKFHMSDVEAAVGLANLPYVPLNLSRHATHATAYNRAGMSSYVPKRSTWWLYNMHVPDREAFISEMAKRGVQCAQTHARNDRHPIFDGSMRRDLAGVREFDEHQVSVPVGWHLTEEDVTQVILSATAALATQGGDSVNLV